MGWVVAAAISILGGIGAYFGLRSKFTSLGYDQAVERQKTQANMVQKEVARKDKAIDSKVVAARVKIKATTDQRLQETKGNAANRLIKRTLKAWSLRNK